MKPRSRHHLKDKACPHCGRFYFLPDAHLIGMRHVRMHANASGAAATHAGKPAEKQS